MKFVIATKNPGKLREISEILTQLGIEHMTQAEAGIDIEAEETGATFMENATLKAEAVCKAAGYPAIADDTGLMVDALDGAPGVHSKRFGGGGLDSEGLCRYLLKLMEGVEQRRAKFVSSIVCAFPDGRLLSAEGECSGTITTSPRGISGFGYDPVFLPDGSEKTMAEMSPDEKNAVSHRGKALNNFSAVLQGVTADTHVRGVNKDTQMNGVTADGQLHCVAADAQVRGVNKDTQMNGVSTGSQQHGANTGAQMKIGVYGGSFNPPHIGHIQAAKDAFCQLGLDLLIIVPAGNPPHKKLPEGSPAPEIRLQMTREAFAGIAGTVVSDIEIMNPDVRYTVDTVAAIRKEHADGLIYLLVGTDMYLSLETWKDSATLMKNAVPAVLSRSVDDEGRIAEYSDALEKRFGVNTIIVRNTVVDISSSELRGMLPERAGSGYIIDAIYSYIVKYSLYGAKPGWDWLRSKAYDMLEPSRIPHVAGCETESVSLAEKWSVDVDDAREAAILHDVTKKLSVEEHMRIIEASAYRTWIHDVPRMDEEKLFHPITGMIVARDVFGVSDAVAEAIRWHTTGKAHMSDLEKVIYLADYIEPSRELDGIYELRDISYKDLNAAMILGLQMSIQDMETRGVIPNPVTYSALKDLE